MQLEEVVSSSIWYAQSWAMITKIRHLVMMMDKDLGGCVAIY